MPTGKRHLPNITYTEEADQFVGLYTKDGELAISAPKALRFSENENERRKELTLFLKSINLAKTVYKENIKEHKDLNNTFWPITSYLWIIQDYLSNGFFYNRDKKFFNENKGKIEWKRTLKKMPIVSNGNIIYDRFVTSRMSPTNDDIANIYKYCLKLSSDRIGWLFNYQIDVEIHHLKTLPEMIYITKSELSETFDDVKRLRFRHMLTILSDADEGLLSPTNYTYGINNYYYVFERMIDQYFHGLSENAKKKFNPIGKWQLNGMKPFPSSTLRPDTLFWHDGILYILDSKMYKYGHTGKIEDLPETTSIQKQITYGDYVSGKIESPIRNAFIIPFDKELDVFRHNPNIRYVDSNNEMAYIGYATGEWRENKKDYDEIYTFLIDMNFLIKSYAKDNKVLVSMCETIEKAIDNKRI